MRSLRRHLHSPDNSLFQKSSLPEKESQILRILLFSYFQDGSLRSGFPEIQKQVPVPIPPLPARHSLLLQVPDRNDLLHFLPEFPYHICYLFLRLYFHPVPRHL